MRLALAAGLALLATAIAVRLSRPPLTVLATNSVAAERPIKISKGNESLCQSNETLPGGVSAIRLAVSVNIGPKVTVTVMSGSQVITKGAQAAGWTGEDVTVPIAPVPSTVAGASVCLAIGPTVEPIGLLGQKSQRPAVEGPGKIRVEYLRPGSQSWWSMAMPMARRMGLGRSPSGTWVAFIPLVLMAAAVGLAAWLLLGELGRRAAGGPPPIAGAQLASLPPAPVDLPHDSTSRRGGPTRRPLSMSGRVPRAAWVCGAVAWLSAASWSIVMPPFQVPDEPAHFAYAQQLAETGSLPTSYSVRYAPEELAALTGLDHNEVRGDALHGTISSPSQQQFLEHYLAQPFPRHGEGGAGVATSQPPLYYALQSIPYRLASSGNLLERLALMRLLSTLMAGLTALFAYLFLREALPGSPWAWTVGGLAVALFPLVGFMSGAVNPDSMLCAVSAALFYCLARAFRRGFSTQMAVAIGVLTAVGFLTKLNFLGLVPGVALALAILTRRAVRSEGRAAYRSLALAGAIGASPVCVYALINILSNHAGLGLASTGIRKTSKHGLFGELGYIWQLYLPRLPGMTNDFPGLLTSRLWFDRSVGLYGWLDTTFPTWVYNVALVPAGVIAALCARALLASRTELRRRIWELLAYATIGLGVMALVGADSFLELSERSGGYTEPRYLLPMAVLFGAILALAARGAGRRWGPAVGALIVVLILGHDIFSQLLVVSRYYG